MTMNGDEGYDMAKAGDGDEHMDQDEEDADVIKEIDYWTVINAYCGGKGLVRQQLDSFNEFVENTMQEIVDERSRLTLDQHTQYSGMQSDQTVSWCR